MKSSPGFSMVEILVIVVAVAILGAGGYLSLAERLGPQFLNQPQSSQSATQQSTPTPTASPSTTPTPNPAANWLTYTSPQEKLSFKYPLDWTLTRVASMDPNGDAVQLLSPSKDVQLAYDSLATGLGGACGGDPCPQVTFYDKLLLANSGSKYNLYVVDYSYPTQSGLAFKMGVIDEQTLNAQGTQTPFYTTFKSSSRDADVWFYLKQYKIQNAPTAPADFFGLSEVKTAKQILSSVSY